MSTTLIDEVRSGTAPPLVPITVEQLQQMTDSGIFHDGDPIELIDGLLVWKDRSARGENLMNHDPRHALLIKLLHRLLTHPCDTVGWHVQIQLPVTLNTINAPEPDVAVVRGNERDYADRHPGPADLPLVIEVALSSLSIDRTTKQRLYATASIPQYWLVNIPDSQVEVYEQPDMVTGKYAQTTVYGPGQTISWVMSPTQILEINITDLVR